MDLMYIAHPSMVEDFRIMLATMKILFLAESTEGVEEGAVTAIEVKGLEKQCYLEDTIYQAESEYAAMLPVKTAMEIENVNCSLHIMKSEKYENNDEFRNSPAVFSDEEKTL